MPAFVNLGVFITFDTYQNIEIMYQLTVAPEQVNETLSKHILADGFDLT